MDITGAIFDCDGTLLDSMGMWSRVSIELLASYGVADPRRVFDETEHISQNSVCDVWHDQYGVGPSGRALYDDLYERVKHAYEHDVKAFPGAREFLEALAGAGVRMVIASSTESSLVKVALAAHGMDGYFMGAVPLERVAYGKDHPDIYLEALRELGTAKESTWVFEDAPFGLASAQGAGFPTVGLLNDHDGRDPEEVAAHSSILVHGYAELSLALIHDYTPRGDESRGTLRALLVDGSPEPSSAGLVRQLAEQSDYVIAVDRGAHVLREAGIAPDLYCGDEDSSAAGDAVWARAHARGEIRYPAEKYETDLGLALWCARNEAARRRESLQVTLTCATGGKPDHALGVLGLLAQHAEASPRVAEDGLEYRVLSPEGAESWEFGAAAKGHTFSLVALREGTVVSESGARWNLDHRELPLLGDEGISNVAGAQTKVSCHAGIAVVFLYR